MIVDINPALSLLEELRSNGVELLTFILKKDVRIEGRVRSSIGKVKWILGKILWKLPWTSNYEISWPTFFPMEYSMGSGERKFPITYARYFIIVIYELNYKLSHGTKVNIKQKQVEMLTSLPIRERGSIEYFSIERERGKKNNTHTRTHAHEATKLSSTILNNCLRWNTRNDRPLRAYIIRSKLGAKVDIANALGEDVIKRRVYQHLGIWTWPTKRFINRFMRASKVSMGRCAGKRYDARAQERTTSTGKILPVIKAY